MNRMAYGVTDIGLLRTNNEDSIFISNNKISRLNNLFIVADGMGGHKAGEIASSQAIDFFCDYIYKNEFDGKYTELFLADAVKYANQMVYYMSRESESYNGMGTTFTVCCTDSINLYFAHVGDSRIYLITLDSITQITEDHTFVYEMIKSGKLSVEDAKKHPNRNVITRALGTDIGTFIDSGYIPLSGDEQILLCTDGLTNMVDEQSIWRVVTSEAQANQKINQLVEMAKQNGGSDNLSIILA